MMAGVMRLFGCCVVIAVALQAVAAQQEAAEPAKSSPVSTWISGDHQIWCFQFPLTEESPSGVFLITEPEVRSVTVDEVLAGGVGYNGLPLLRRLLERAGAEEFEPGPEARLVWSAASCPFRSDRSFSLTEIVTTEPADIPPGDWKLHGKGDLNFVIKIDGQDASTACIIFPNGNRFAELKDWLIWGRFVNSIDAAIAIATRDGQQLHPIESGANAVLPTPADSVLVGFSPEEAEMFTPKTSNDAMAPERDTNN